LGGFDLWFVILLIVDFVYRCANGFIKLGKFIKKCWGFIKLGEFIKKSEKDYYTFWFFFFTFMKEIKKATAQKIADSNKNHKIKNCFDFDRVLKRGVRCFLWEGRSSLCEGCFLWETTPIPKIELPGGSDSWFLIFIFENHVSIVWIIFRLRFCRKLRFSLCELMGFLWMGFLWMGFQ